MKIHAQKPTEVNPVKKIKKDFDKYSKKHNLEGYLQHHKILKQSLKFNALKYELGAYRKLATDHVLQEIGERNFDSVLYYFNKYEAKIIDIDTTKVENKRLFHEIATYYMTKAEILENELNLIDSGETALKKAYPYVKGSNINLLTRYDIKVSTLLLNKKKYDEALAVVTNRLKDTASLKDKRKKSLFDRIASVYMKKENYGSAYVFYNKSLNIAQKNKKEAQIWTSKTNLNSSAFFHKNRQNAIDSAKLIKNYYSNVNKVKNKKGLSRILIQLSDFYSKMNNLEKATFYREEAVKKTTKSRVLVEIYKELARYSMKSNNYDLAVKYYEKTDQIRDSLKEVEKNILTKYGDANLKLMKANQINKDILFKNQLLEVKNKKQQLYIGLGSVGLAVFLLITSLFFLYDKYKKTNQNLQVLKASEKQLLEEQIKLQEDELEASAIAIRQRIEILDIIKAELNDIEDENFKLAKVKKKVKELIVLNSDMSVITDRIESKNFRLTSILKMNYSNLSENELRYCLLTKLNLSLKETAAVLNISPNSVKVARSRIKKKLGVSHELSLKEHLNTIDVKV